MNPKDITTIRIENRTIFKVLVGITAFVALLNLAVLLRAQLTWIVAAFFLTLALNPAVELLQKYMPRHSRGLSLAAVMSGLLAVVVFLAVTFIPVLIEQSAILIETLPGTVQSVQDNNSAVGRLVDKYNLEGVVQNAADDIAKWLVNSAGSAVSIAQGVFNGFAAAATIFVTAIFMLLEGPRWNERIWRYHPDKTRQRNLQLASEMYQVVSSYFTGVLTIAAIAAACSIIAMTLVGLPYAVPLGILVGILGLIPYVGATIAAVIVVIVAFFTSTSAAIILAIYFFIYQQVENNILQPIIQGRTTSLSPLIVTIAILLGASAAGLFGALIAIPVAASLKVLAVHWFKHHRVEEPVKVASKKA
ncbi:AI-2E family transporter [Patescibacteria group bacterium]|nr:MAG: AI-2E family transporter [Patescibacteria group bacterium]